MFGLCVRVVHGICQCARRYVTSLVQGAVRKLFAYQHLVQECTTAEQWASFTRPHMYQPSDKHVLILRCQMLANQRRIQGRTTVRLCGTTV